MGQKGIKSLYLARCDIGSVEELIQVEEINVKLRRITTIELSHCEC